MTGLHLSARPTRLVVWMPFLVGVAAQIAYPLVTGAVRDWLIVVIVAVLALAAFAHAGAELGPAAVGVLAVVTVIGFAAEVVGVHTGRPFGHYAYLAAAGPRVLGVPLSVPPAWTMMAWPSAVAARRLARSPGARVVVGTWALASWDLFLDPQMVDSRIWQWRSVGAHLPGVPTVALTNYLGWLFVSLVISVVLQTFLASRDRFDDAQPIAIYLWTYAASVLALAAFLDLRAAAAWGAIGMGLVAVPLAVRARA